MVRRWGCLVNVEQEEVEDGTAVKPARVLVVEIGEQHLHSPAAAQPQNQSVGESMLAPAQSAAETMRDKLKTTARKAIYKMRKAVVEPVFGQIKAVRGFAGLFDARPGKSLGGMANHLSDPQPVEVVSGRSVSANGQNDSIIRSISGIIRTFVIYRAESPPPSDEEYFVLWSNRVLPGQFASARKKESSSIRQAPSHRPQRLRMMDACRCRTGPAPWRVNNRIGRPS
jgi:hypothetical protein